MVLQCWSTVEFFACRNFVDVLHPDFRLCVLRVHSLSTNGIRDDCIDFVSQWLRRDKHTTELNLWGNYVRIAGVSSILSHLASNHTLTSLNLGSNDMGSAGIYPIGKCLVYAPGSGAKR